MYKSRKPAALICLGALLGGLISLGAVLHVLPAAADSSGQGARWWEDGIPGSFPSFLPVLLKNWAAPQPTGGELLITEVYYDPLGSEPEEEWIEIYNPGPQSIDLSEYKVGDEETPGGGEGMYTFQAGALLPPGELIVIANQAASFQALYGFAPDYEFRESDPGVPTLIKHSVWAGGLVTMLNTSDEILVLDGSEELVDAISWGGSTYAFNPSAPDVDAGHSLERTPAYLDTDSAADWADQGAPTPGAVDLSTPTPPPTPTATGTPVVTGTLSPTATAGPTGEPSPSPTISVTPGEALLLVSEALYDPADDEPEGEWIEVYNAGSSSVDLSPYKIGDEETVGGGEGMYSFPAGASVGPGSAVVVANSAAAFIVNHGSNPDFELVDSDPAVPDMTRYTPWATGNISLGNSGDEVLLVDSVDEIIDSLSWGSSTFSFDPAADDVDEGHSLERVPANVDTDTAADWHDQPVPDPGQVTLSGVRSALAGIDGPPPASGGSVPGDPARDPRPTPTPRATRPAGHTRTPAPTLPPDPSVTPLPTSTTTATALTPTPLPSATPTGTPTQPSATSTPTSTMTFTPTTGPTATPSDPTMTPTLTPTPVAVDPLLISEVFYDTPGSDPEEEWIEIYNPNPVSVDLSGYKIGDEEIQGGSEGMYQFPSGASIGPGGRVVVALQAAGFIALYGFNPDYEIMDSDPTVPDLMEHSAWGGGPIAMSNTGDEVVLLDEADIPVDVVTFEGGSYPGVTAHPGVSTGHSIERIPPEADTDDCSLDFVDQSAPTPGG